MKQAYAGDYADYLAAAAHNLQTYLEQAPTKSFCGQKYFMLTGNCTSFSLAPPGSHALDIARKVDDIVAGSVNNVIPFNNLDGDDGIRFFPDGTFNRTELKLALKSKARCFIGPNGGICVGSKDAKKNPNIRGDTKANYEIGNNLAKKNVDTIMTLIDTDTGDLIESICLAGEHVLDHLTYNQVTRELKSGKKRSIPLTYFLEKGRRLDNPEIPKVGLENWEDSIYIGLGLDPKAVTKNMTWTRSLEDQVYDLYRRGNSQAEIGVIMGVSKSSITNKLNRIKHRYL